MVKSIDKDHGVVTINTHGGTSLSAGMPCGLTLVNSCFSKPRVNYHTPHPHTPTSPPGDLPRGVMGKGEGRSSV